jgi:large subunit ribosomal protein L17
MNHRKVGRKFGRVKKVRTAMFKTLLGSFFLHEKIKTTEPKAKELKTKIDRLINKAKVASDKTKKANVMRELTKYLPEVAIKKITGEFLSKVEGRKSGYTRVIKLGARKSDGAKMAVLELV